LSASDPGALAEPVASQFLQASGTSLTLRGHPIRLKGASIYGTSNPGGSGSPGEVLAWAAAANLNMIRLVNVFDERGLDDTAPFAEADWIHVDQLLADISEHGMLALLDLSAFRNHLVNRDIRMQGWEANCVLNGNRVPVDYNLVDPYRVELESEWQSFIDFVTTRINTITGVKYADDPTIAVISLAGEPQPPESKECGKATSGTELTEFYRRTLEMLRLDDPNHLRSSGGLIHLDWQQLYGHDSGIDGQAIFALADNTLPALHTYPPAYESDGTPVDYQTPVLGPYATGLGKPWLTEEFGWKQEIGDSVRASRYRWLYDEQQPYGSDGALFWNLGPEVAGGSHDANPSTALTWTAIVAPSYSITAIGGNSCYSIGYEVNERGAAVVHVNTGPSHYEAARWSNGTLTILSSLNDTHNSIGRAINEDGVIVGESYDGHGGVHAISWNGTTAGDLGVLAGNYSTAFGINDLGQIVGDGQVTEGGSSHALLWNGTTPTDLGGLSGGGTSHARGINNAGQVIGDSDVESGGRYHASIWHNGTITDLGTLPGDDLSNGTAINTDGHATGRSMGRSDGGQYAFFWNGSTMEELPLLPGGSFFEAAGINDLDQIVGRADMNDGSGQAAVLWERSTGQTVDLNTQIPPGSGWQLLHAFAISNARQIVGYGSESNCLRAFLMTPVDPSAPPGAPGSVTAAAGDGQVSVSWAAPTADGGSPITSYIVTAAPGGQTKSVAGNVTTGSVTGLTNGTPYTFTVTATNDMGTGIRSDPSRPVTPRAGAPAPQTTEKIIPPSGDTATTDPTNAGPTPSDPVTTSVTVPATTNGGSVTISETAINETPPSGGYQFLGQQVDITSTAATSAGNPLTMVFTIDSSAIRTVFGLGPTDPLPVAGVVDITRAEGSASPGVVGSCTATAPLINPDPCVSTRQYVNGGDDLRIIVLTGAASHWNTAIKVVTVTNSGYSPKTAIVPQGGIVLWVFNTSKTHSATDNLKLGPAKAALFDSGRLSSGRYAYLFRAAGTYTYGSTVKGDPGSFAGSIGVPVRITPTTGGTTTSYTVTWSSAALSGYVFDVQYRFKKSGSKSWSPYKPWQSGMTTTNATFIPALGAGTYAFSARLRNSTTGMASLWSPELTIVP
jgi:probable HAF family extracellular repeat protein